MRICVVWQMKQRYTQYVKIYKIFELLKEHIMADMNTSEKIKSTVEKKDIIIILCMIFIYCLLAVTINSVFFSEKKVSKII